VATIPFILNAIAASGIGPESGAKAYTYVKDTSTPLAVYTDTGLSIAAANPVVANSLGYMVFYFSSTLNYTIVIKTANDATTLLTVTYTASGSVIAVTQGTVPNYNALTTSIFALESVYQGLDVDLTAYAGLSSTGMVARTGAGTAAVRSIAASGNGISVANGNGVSANPTVSLNTQLSQFSVASLTDNGYLQKQDEEPNGFISVQPSVMRGVASLADYSTTPTALVGDGSTNEAAVVAAAITAAPARLIIPAGKVVKSNSLANGAAVELKLDGPGQLKTNDNNSRAPIFRAITAAPSSFGTHTSAETAFNGDLSNVYEAVEYRITGAATAGQPTTGYLYRPEISMSYRYLYNTSGYNHSTSGNGGRTGIVAQRTALFHAGQGDLVAYNFTAFCNSTLSGSTHFLANPAIVGVNGDMTAGADGIYFNPWETYLDDAGYDVAAVGAVYNLDRNDATGAKSAFWSGVRVQSFGTERPDAMYSGTGIFDAGLSFAAVTLNTDKAAIVIKESDRIYLEGTNSDPNGGDNGISTGDTWIERNSSGFISLVYNNTNVSQISDFWAYFIQKVNTSDSYEVDGTKVVGNRATGWGAPTGTATRTAFATTTVTLEELAQRVKALVDDLTTHGLIGS
jgi:hypothetical protein